MSEILYLADVIDNDPASAKHHCAAAAELRRLSAVEAERDALLGVLRTIEATKRLAQGMQQEWCPAAQGMVRMARAAIAKAGGGNG